MIENIVMAEINIALVSLLLLFLFAMSRLIVNNCKEVCD